MNLIGHLACTGAGSLPFAWGAILPDLLNLFGVRATLRPRQLNHFWEKAPEPLPEQAEITAGLAFHQHVDAHFHRAALFTENSRHLRQTLENASSQGGLKRFFAAHILLEVFLDHLLLAALPRSGERMNQLLHQAQRGALLRFVNAHPAVEGNAFCALLQRLESEDFMGGYRREETLLERVGRMLLRTRQRDFNAEERQALHSWFKAKAPSLSAMTLVFVEEMERSVPEFSKPYSGLLTTKGELFTHI